MAVEAWKERCYISIVKKAASPIELYLEALSEDVTMNDGGRPVTVTPLTNAGNLMLTEAMKESTIEIVGYTTGCGDPTPAAAANLIGFDELMMGTDNSGASTQSDPADQGKFMVGLLWSEDHTGTTALSTTSSESYRKVYVEGKMSGLTATFTGQPKVYKVTCTLTFAPTNKYGIGNLYREYNATGFTEGVSTYNTTEFPEDGSAYDWTTL